MMYATNVYCLIIYFSEDGVCVSSCSPGLVHVNDECIACVAPRVYFNNTCISQCPDGYAIASNKVCEKCISPTPYQYNDKCVGQCPAGTYDDNHKCRTCSSPNIYLQNQTCVPSCSIGMIYNELNECIQCVEPNIIMHNNTCIESCPNGYIKDNYTCRKCNLSAPNVLNNSCVEICPVGYIIDNYTCYQCPENKRFIYNSTCLGECPERTSYNDSSYICISCQTTDFILQTPTNRQCIQKCPEGYIANNSTLTCEMESACLPNPCKNNSTCTMNRSGEFKCICQVGFSGLICNETNEDFTDVINKLTSELTKIQKLEMNSDKYLMQITCSYFANIIEQIKDIPGDLLYEIDELIFQIASKQLLTKLDEKIQNMLSGKLPYNNDIMGIADTTLFVKSKV